VFILHWSEPSPESVNAEIALRTLNRRISMLPEEDCDLNVFLTPFRISASCLSVMKDFVTVQKDCYLFLGDAISAGVISENHEAFFQKAAIGRFPRSSKWQ
jgi:hypothetical protein